MNKFHNEKFVEKLRTLEEHDRKVCYNYFTKQKLVYNLFDIVRKKKGVIKTSFGNFNSKIVYVVDFETTKDEPLLFLKETYAKNGFDFYNAYITNLNKTSNREFNEILIQKELDILKPSKVVFIGDKVENLSGDFTQKHIEVEDFILLYRLNNKMISKEDIDKDKVKEVIDTFVDIFKFAFY